MQVVSTSTVLLDRLEVVVDHNAEPADLDEALAGFLLRFTKGSNRLPPAAPAAAVDFH